MTTRRSFLRLVPGALGTVGTGLGWPLEASQPPEPRVRPIGPRLQAMEPYDLDFPRSAILDLHTRIDRTRWPTMPFDTGWSAGTNDEVLRELVSYWRYDYDWFEVQDDLNELDHLRGPIEGEAMHCVRYPAQGNDAASDPPVLLLHGWPGSFHEFSQAAPLLADGLAGEAPRTVIVPSLPGFCLSEPPRARGMNPGLIAERLHALMLELGHERYGVAGGDWGAIIGTQIARKHPDAVTGLYVNFVASAPPPPDGADMSLEEREYRNMREAFGRSEQGYSSIQGSRPQTLAYAQTDSPVGWLAWILEKYWAWSDHGDDLWDTYTREDILTTAMLYWLPGTILSASRIYYETSNPVGDGMVGGRVTVPTGYGRFPAEPWGPPREVVERTYDLVHYSDFDRGGHFPALEQPEAWSADVARFFRSIG